jgi:integrase
VGQTKRAQTLRDTFEDVVSEVESSGALADGTFTRFVTTADRFVSFCGRGHGITSLDEVTPRHVEEFVRAPVDGRPVSVAGMHTRRTALRTFFRSARQLGLLDGDPSLDVVLPVKSTLLTRPLTDDEVGLCRSCALTSLSETRRPAAWALAETSARTSELPNITASDVDLDTGRVWIGGGTRTVARWGTLSEWGVVQLERRVRAMRDLSVPVVYSGRPGGESGQSSSSMAICDTLARAGLGDEPDVRPLSVAAWAGVKIFEQTARIDAVARRLGMRSLDRAALLIGWDWNEPAQDI